MNVLIAGCGFVGSELGRRLVAEGHDVWGVRRSEAPLPEGVRRLRLDLRDRDALRERIPDDLDAAVFAASADRHDEEGYRAAYVDGMRGLLAGLGSRRLRRLAFVSSTGVYGQSDGEWVDDSSVTEPSSFSGRVMLEAEALALGSDHPSTVLRFGGIYGPGRTRLLDSVRDGSAAWDPERPIWTNRIHRDDGAAAIHWLLRLPEEDVPERLDVVDDEPATKEAVVTWIARELGVDRPPPRGGGDSLHRRGAGKRVSNRRLRATGFRLRYPSYREGYGAMIDGTSGSKSSIVAET